MLEIKWFSPLEISSLVTAQVEPMWDLGREVAISKLCFCASITCITAFRWSHSGSTAQHLRTAKSHICPLNLIRWFLGSDYRTSRIHRNSQKRALKQSCRLGVQNKGLDAQRQIYARKVRMLNPVSQFVEEVKGFDSGFFFMPPDSSITTQTLNLRSDRCHIPICIRFWSLPGFSYLSEFQALAESIRDEKG